MDEQPELQPPESEAGNDHVDDRMLAIAYHEAGHAVAALSLGRLIHKVTIKPGKSQFGAARLGVCELQKGRSKASKHQLDDTVLILFAGMVAEAQFSGRYCPSGAEQDLLDIRRLLCDRAGSRSQFERMHRRLLDKTEHLLSDDTHREAIEKVALLLVEKVTISGRAVRHVFDQATHRRR
ncbi:MAG: cell division protein FtsH [Planctomycetota bacterium]